MGFKASLDGVLTENDTNIFLEKTVQEFIWGYDDKLTKMGRQFMPEGALKSDQFGLFAGRNHSVDARFSVNTGKGNLDKLGILKRFNNETSYYVWPGKGCDKVKGVSRTQLFTLLNADFYHEISRVFSYRRCLYGIFL